MTTTPPGTTTPISVGAGPAGPAARTPAPDVSEAISAAVLAVPGVASLHGGAFGQVASYLPGRSVTGVRVRPDVTDVHVVLFWGSPVLATADHVRAVVQPLISAISARVDVTIDDIVDRPAAPPPIPVTDPNPPAPANLVPVPVEIFEMGAVQPPSPTAAPPDLPDIPIVTP